VRDRSASKYRETGDIDVTWELDARHVVVMNAGPELTWPARARLPTIRDDDPARFDRAYECEHAPAQTEIATLDPMPLEVEQRLSWQCARATIYEEDSARYDVDYRRAHADSITTLPDLG